MLLFLWASSAAAASDGPSAPTLVVSANEPHAVPAAASSDPATHADPYSVQWEPAVNAVMDLIKEEQIITSESWYVIGAYATNTLKTGLSCWAAPFFNQLPPNAFIGTFITLTAIESVCDYNSKQTPTDNTSLETQFSSMLQNLTVLEKTITSSVQDCRNIAAKGNIEELKNFINTISNNPIFQDYAKLSQLKNALQLLIQFLKDYDDFLTKSIVATSSSSQAFANVQNSLLLWSFVGATLSTGIGTDAASKADPVYLAAAQTITLFSNSLRQGANLSKEALTMSAKFTTICKQKRSALSSIKPLS